MNNNKVRKLQARREEQLDLLELLRRIMQTDIELGEESPVIQSIANDSLRKLEELNSLIDSEINNE